MGVWQSLQDLYPEIEPDALLQKVDRDFCGLIEDLNGRSATEGKSAALQG